MKKIYLSKCSVSDADLQKMIKELEEQGYEIIVSYYNEVDGDFEKEKLQDTIDECELVLILIDGNCDEDVDNEIEISVLCGKRAVGVYVAGAGEGDIPESLQKMGSGIVPCDVEKILKIAQGDSSDWLTPEGERRESSSSGDRSDC
jgi:predicted phosphodiesterase